MSAHLLDCIEDAWESQVNIKHVCRNCGALSRNLSDGWCSRCNGHADEARLEQAQATQRACRLAREAQQRRRPDLFDSNGVWAPFRGTR